MNYKYLLSITLIIVMLSCKKENETSNPAIGTHAQARAANIFGQPLQSEMPCLTEETDPGFPSRVTYFSYNSDGLITKSVYKDGIVAEDSVLFYYDSQNRLISIKSYETYSFEYNSDNKISRFTTAGSMDTFYISYLNANKVTVFINYASGGQEMDTLLFDNNFNELSYSAWYFDTGSSTTVFQGSSAATYNMGVSNPFYPSALTDYYFIQHIIDGGPQSQFLGRNLITNIVYNSNIRHWEFSLIDSHINGNYPTSLKYHFLDESGFQNDTESGFVYNCN